MGEVVTRAKQSMAFVLLQELACGLPQCLMLTLRRDIVFSQAVGCLIRHLSSTVVTIFDVVSVAVIEHTMPAYVLLIFFFSSKLNTTFSCIFPLHPRKYFIMC